MKYLNKQNFLNAIQSVKSLIPRGNSANINIKFCDLEGNTIFHYAVYTGDYELLKNLLAIFPHPGKENSSVDSNSRENIGYNTKNDTGYSPLHIAAEENRIKTLKALLETKISPNEKDEFSRTALHIAIERNNPEIVALLLDNKNTDPNATTINGSTPLHLAALLNNVEMTKLLIKKGTNLNIKDKDNKTPIYFAVTHNNLDIIDLLLKNGAIIEKDSPLAHKVFFLALQQSNIQLIQRLLDQNIVNPNAPTINGSTPLHLATLLNNLEMTKLLIKKGAKVRDSDTAKNIINLLMDKNNDQFLKEDSAFAQEILNLLENDNNIDLIKKGSPLAKYALGLALVNNNLRVAQILLNHDLINFKSQFYYVFQLIEISIRNRNTEAIDLLLQNGVEIFNNPNTIRQILYLAISQRNTKLINRLISDQNSIETFIVNDFMPMHLAIQKGYIDIVELLLKKAPKLINNNFILLEILYLVAPLSKAETIIKNGDITEQILSFVSKMGDLIQKGSPLAKYAFYLAIKNGNLEVTKILLNNHKVNTNDEIYHGLPSTDFTRIYNSRDETKSFFTTKSLITIEEEGNSPPLHIAARSGNTNIVRALINANAHINHRNIYQQTALMIASYYGHTDIVKTLIQAEADLSLEDKDGRTALMWAITNNKLDTVKALINKNDEPVRVDYSKSILMQNLEKEKFQNALNYQNRYFITPLMWSIQSEKDEIAHFLIKSNANPHMTDAHGRSALMLAVEKNKLSLVKLLLEKEVNPNCRDKDGRTALDIAQKIGNQDMLRILHDAIRNQQTEVRSHVNKEQTRRTNLQPTKSKCSY